MAVRNEHDMEFLNLLARMNQKKDISFFCRDTIDSDVTSEQQHFSQARQFLVTARQDVQDHFRSEHRPEG